MRGSESPGANPQDVAAGLATTTGPEANMGSKTKKRWSADMIERGQGRNQPRLFDNIPIARVGPRDLEHLDVTSSMEPIRNQAMRRQKEEWKQNALNPRRSRLWSDSSQVQGSGGGPSPGGLKDRSFGKVETRTLIRGGSEPTIRGLDKTEKKEPRFFGTTAKPATQAQTAVRCGGFQRLDWPPVRQARTQQASGSRTRTGR